MKRLFAMLLLCAGAAAGQSMETTLQAKLPARWWRQAALIAKLGLSEDQQKKIEDNFQQSRGKLIDLTVAVDKEEAALEPLVAADKPDEAKIRVQIDRIAQARADLEKSNAYLLLGVRMILTSDQWKKLQEGGGMGPRARGLKK